MTAVDAQLAALERMPGAQLRDEWTRLTCKPTPRISPKLLRLALAWEHQARAFSGLSRETRRKLDQLAAARTTTSATTPGMRLVRERGGQVHVVTIGEDKVIRWNDREWRSLSEVARAITSTRWSGPAIFGLKRRLAA